MTNNEPDCMAEPVVEPVKGWTDAGITKIKVPDLRIRS